MKINSSQLAKKFDLQEIGSTKEITRVGTPDDFDNSSIGWSKNEEFLSTYKNGTIVTSVEQYESIVPNTNCTYLLTNGISPRLQFAKILDEYFALPDTYYLVNEVENHRENKSIFISENVFIGQNVTIGEGTIIHPNVSIYANTRIGKHCVFMHGVSIATEGLGLEMDEEINRYFKFPQMGGVIIEDYVEFGPSTTVRRAALKNTIIRKGTKIGALVNVGHNCEIGENCILTCNNVLAGSSKLGNGVFMGVGSSLKTGKHVADNAQIGMGAIVTKDIPANEVWVGNPAKFLKKND